MFTNLPRPDRIVVISAGSIAGVVYSNRHNDGKELKNGKENYQNSKTI
jgi:hypothetical protein